MHQAQPIFPHGSEHRHDQQRTLPSFRDLLARGNFLPENRSLSHDRQSAAYGPFPPFSRNERGAGPLLRPQPDLPIHGFGTIQAPDELLNLKSRSDGPISSDDHTPPRKESLGKTSSHAHGSVDGPLASDTSLVRRRQPEKIDPPTTDHPRKRRREAEALIDLGTAPKRKSELQRNSKEIFRKQENSKTAAIAHMEKERERRLHIGDLIKQIASHVKFSGPKIEILKRAVDCIHDAKSKTEDLEAELEDLKRLYQAMSEQCSKLSRALTQSFAKAKETCLEDLSWREDTSEQGHCRRKEWYSKEHAI